MLEALREPVDSEKVDWTERGSRETLRCAKTTCGVVGRRDCGGHKCISCLDNDHPITVDCASGSPYFLLKLVQLVLLSEKATNGAPTFSLRWDT